MNQILQFLREVRTEFNNITWPKKDALLKLTIVVISISVITSLILGGFDYLFTISFGKIGEYKVSQTQIDSPVPTLVAQPTLEIPPVASPTAVKK